MANSMGMKQLCMVAGGRGDSNQGVMVNGANNASGYSPDFEELWAKTIKEGVIIQGRYSAEGGVMALREGRW